MPKTIWLDTLIDKDIGASGLVSETLMSNVTDVDTRMAGMTLLRTIVRLDVAATIHDSGEGSVKVGIGIGVVSQDALAVGGSSLPSPATATDFPTRGWIFRTYGRVYGFIANDPAVFQWAIDKDIRAKRILDNGESFIAYVPTQMEGASVSVTVLGLIRQLWLIT